MTKFVRGYLAGMFVLAIGGAHAAVVLQPWTSNETGLFIITQAATGSGWTGNTLTLNFGPVEGYQTIDASSFTYRLPAFFPAHTIGIQFGVTSTLQGLHGHREGVDFEGTRLPLNPNEYILQRADNTQRSNFAIIDWQLYVIRQPFDPRVILVDIPESTRGDVTTVQVLFLQSLLNSPAQLIGFAVDGGSVNNIGTPGTTTFSDVSWLICEVDCPPSNLPSDGTTSTGLPEPGTLTLLALGLVGLGYSRRKR